MLIKKILILLLLAVPMALWAQDGGTAFNILRLPYSSHAAAVGGANISLPDDDIMLAMHNPALLANVSDKTLSLSYMSYMSDSKVAGAAFNRMFGERSAAALAARYIDYGSFDGYTDDNIATGSFGAKDIELSFLYNYLLSDSWSGGVTGKFIYSKYESYSSVALGVDLGVNYYNPDSEFSASFVLRNLGGQVKAFEDKHESMPFDVQLGLTKRLAHAPLRLSLTLVNLHKWSKDDFYNPDGSEDSVGDILLKHAIFGADLLIGSNFYASLGYNYRIAEELSSEGTKWDGLTFGAGLTLKKFKIGVSYSKLHVSSGSLMFAASYTL
ncbi:MAG: type IX secretion system protein PorQ [Bacteroidaceae bacterium]|nr:type IX secretion system protein PorQ [Bacteroidaceae bacterium]